MAYPTSVNSQITDAVTQVNVKVIGESPDIEPGQLDEQTKEEITNTLKEQEEQHTPDNEK